VYDDALLIGATQGFLPLTEALDTHAIAARFHTPNGLHLSCVTPQIAARLKRSGFTTLRFGYESGATRFRSQTSGKASAADAQEKIRQLLDAGFRGSDIGIYIMAGLLGQSLDDLRRDIEFAASLKIKVKPVFLSPVPGTALFRAYAKSHPEIVHDPLWHNDTFFITRLPGWSEELIARVMAMARECNSSL
jgi:radical SAM superfamily enzyme YgiQ (UPF0313 family)